MTISALFSFILYSFVTSVTPGPNNIMLLSSGITFGFKRSIKHILGIGFGFGLMVTLVGFGVGSFLSNSKFFYEIIKLIGIFYLLYLSYQIFKTDTISTDSSSNSVSHPLSFLKAALFQWVNPKAWIMTIGAVTTYTSSSDITTFILIGIIYGVISIPSVGLWAYIGDKLQRFITDRKKLKIFNTIMALLLVLSVISPILETIDFFITI